MKPLFISIACLTLSICSNAQNAPAEMLANKIADKMKDSLNLTQSQRQQIFVINIKLANQKKSIFEKYQNRDSIGIHLQLIENTRDSLYREVIDESKYDQYKTKKRHLVAGN